MNSNQNAILHLFCHREIGSGPEGRPIENQGKEHETLDRESQPLYEGTWTLEEFWRHNLNQIKEYAEEHVEKRESRLLN